MLYDFDLPSYRCLSIDPADGGQSVVRLASVAHPEQVVELRTRTPSRYRVGGIYTQRWTKVEQLTAP